MDRGRNIIGESTGRGAEPPTPSARPGRDALAARALADRAVDGHAPDRPDDQECTPSTAEEIDPRDAGGP